VSVQISLTSISFRWNLSDKNTGPRLVFSLYLSTGSMLQGYLFFQSPWYLVQVSPIFSVEQNRFLF
jgi:hypothetical protein